MDSMFESTNCDARFIQAALAAQDEVFRNMFGQDVVDFGIARDGLFFCH